MSLLDTMQRIGMELWCNLEKELKPQLKELDKLQKHITKESASAVLEALEEISGEFHRVIKETREKVEQESKSEETGNDA